MNFDLDQVLYLVPAPLTDNEKTWLLPDDVEIIRTLNFFVVENEKTARKYLKQIKTIKPLREIQMMVLNQNTSLDKKVFSFFLHQGRRIGLMSEAGCPAVADPGAWLVRLAHQLSFKVVPMIGPSSLLLALMASGANGQNFAFKGYLPIDKKQLALCIKKMISKVKNENETQIFIETPYRNQTLLEFLIQLLPNEMMMTVAVDLTDEKQESIISLSINDWKKRDRLPNLGKHLCVFVLG